MTFEERREAGVKLARLSPIVSDAIGPASSYGPFDLQLLFQKIGDAMVRKRSPLSKEEYSELFLQIERLLRSSDERLPDLVAVSLLGTIGTAIEESGFDKEIVEPHIGPNARSYLVALKYL